jgi:peptide/nickel transport system ATP-binding protein
LGKVCEVASSETLYSSPAHPYTSLLLSSIPSSEPEQQEGPEAATIDQPSAVEPPSGCRFRTRCPKATERCAREEPELAPVGAGHFVACHFPNLTVRAEVA